MSNYIRRFEDASLAVGSTTPYLYNYRYDQLNRLTGQDAYTGLNSSSNTWTLTATDYLKERVSYDPNGNIVRYLRNSPFGSNVAMDSLTYTYYPGSNKLKHIRDVVPSTNWAPKYNMADDLNGQTDASNYFYDAIGNLTYDETQRIHVMKWSVYGKLKEQTRNSGWGPRAQTQRYTYDAQGNRIGTRIMHDGKAIYTWYVRDAQGNILSVYSTTGTQSNIADMTLAQTERHIYGSNRLGVVTSTGVDIDRSNAGPALLVTPERMVFGRGIRQYELSNHLGNVLSTISDKKIGVPYASNSSLIEYYKPDIITASEYYPFGMISRTHTRSSFAVHKFGFNGKENDNLLKGIGAQQDYGMRVYDPRLGKFLSVDPLSKSYPWNSPYSYAEGDPINYIDLDGMEQPRQTAQAAPKPVLPRLAQPRELSKLEVDRNGNIINPTQLVGNGPINSGAYAPQAHLVSQKELKDLIPPNAGATINPDGISMTVHGPNGSWQVSLLKSEKPKETPTWVDRAVLRMSESKIPLIKSAASASINDFNSEQGNSNNEQLIYRAGGFTDLNFTPRPGKDDGTGAKSGLSAFTDPLKATQGIGGKVQVISAKALEDMGFILNITNDGHVGIRPRTQVELKDWASSRQSTSEGVHPYTTMAKAARIGEIKVSAPIK